MKTCEHSVFTTRVLRPLLSVLPHFALQKLFDHFDAAIAHAVAADAWQSAELWVRVQKPAAASVGASAGTLVLVMVEGNKRVCNQ